MGLTGKQIQRKRLSQRDRILAVLQHQGDEGVTAESLNQIGFRYSAIIHTLRKDGYVIDTVPRKGTECALYVYRGHKDPGQQDLFSTR